MIAKVDGFGSQRLHGPGTGRGRQRFILPLFLLMGLTAGHKLTHAQTPSVDALNPSVSSYVAPVAVQADGKVLIGGGFGSVGIESHIRLARLSPDGIVETGFTAGANDTVYALAVQPDGKILVGGDFTTLASQGCIALGRLNTNGVFDSGFSTHAFDPPPLMTTTARAQAILVQPDGKIVVGGRLSYNGGPLAGFVRRLNTNGVQDSAFSGAVNGGLVASLALQSDGKILVGGSFTSAGSQMIPRYRLARFNRDGSLDTDFNAALSSTAGEWVLSVTVQADQAILIGGVFTTVAGQPRTNLARLYPSGGLDTTFNPGATGASSSVQSLALQADGKILVGGIFTSLGGASHLRIGRLKPDGTPDSAFTAGAGGDVYGLAIQPDGKILATGYFTSLAGQPRSFVGRLDCLEPAAQSLSYDGTTVTWMRSGTSCEVWRTTFDSSSDGTNWVSLGDGTRIAGGWQLASIALPPGARVRARGYTTGGGFNSSSWFIESVWPPATPAIVTTNLFGVRSNRFGFNIAGSSGSTVVVEGSTDLTGWTPLATNVLSSVALCFSDCDCASFPHRFYRVRLQ